MKDVSRHDLALLAITYFIFVHAIGLYIFTRGFLLTRLTIPSTAPPYSVSNPPPIPPTHSKAIVLIIDALRTDFISPHHPQHSSPYHHGILTLPAELAATTPHHSLIFNAFSDPPTSTMQRLKGITTGSLPTFIDIGSNFASTAIDEDSWISQLVAADKKVIFMGDDTWVNLFPETFAIQHPYDSFNVEDLHTVDNGVIQHLLPYLAKENSTRWDVLIGHFLGVDHVGHRVGPERETMRIKLEQMNLVLRDVVDRMDENTLLVLLGDHGMDQKGNHGGDSDLETASAMWLYSKGVPLSSNMDVPTLVRSWPNYTFPGSLTPLRHIDQIDIVPTLSLLLGIPIPFNNLGSVIPECFTSNMSRLEMATRVNGEQIKRYLHEYGDKNVEGGLDDPWARASAAARLGGAMAALHHSITTHRVFAQSSLSRLRSLWAQFSLSSILVGLTILLLSVPALIPLYHRSQQPGWEEFVRAALTGAMSAAVVGMLLPLPVLIFMYSPLDILCMAIPQGIIASELFLCSPLIFIVRLTHRKLTLERVIGPVILLIHALSFGSNSFIMWEDRIVVYLLVTILIVFLIKSFTAPTAALRLRILGLSLLAGLLVRLCGAITVCREEQQPYCRVTFFSGSTPTAPTWALIAILPLALQLPRVIGLTLDRSKSLGGPARLIVGILWRSTLFISALYWLLEYAEGTDSVNPARIPLLRLIRMWLARIGFFILIGSIPYWLISGLCITIQRNTNQIENEDEAPVVVLGFANVYGSTYLLFYLLVFGSIYLVNQPMGQITLSLLLISLLAYLELIDSRRDSFLIHRSFSSSIITTQPSSPHDSTSNSHTSNTSRNPTYQSISSPPIDPFSTLETTHDPLSPSFTELVPLLLMGFIGFFATGHQAVLTTIQWKAAFVGVSNVVYPWSPFLVALNSFGPFLLSALAGPLLALWNTEPNQKSTARRPVLGHTLRIGIATMIYHTVLTTSSAICAAWLRRHLMVWKVFAPRFMLAAVTLLVVDIGVLLGLMAMRVTGWKVWRTFKCESV
ncbi:hypothetical protein TREMEDRAFT_44276 [Tremella mesenterica DSM 1558]|uniref:uncharacterized protein n=1 Tax=Tremella mesenterica (strain ATCC 24925 / CBS 8224 / DSM 1558 / NBRC 9311 / NRRL Y-6157 / RJB 2259-6 / UBC 559-6) TaxID=578456 RepID=UPI0003F49A42|nr:uncharacterized protein TREMEDRAFT_44276 [Tremella mesenterica DSM 1558]EIW69047.1 hypothetical protein TREMEDRAFT_44276 [Tremella mesenterica DSM 1558]